MKHSRILHFLLVLLIVVVLFPVSSRAETSCGEYEYPVLPGTDAWKSLNSLDEKIAVCQIPEETLHQMDTKDLVLSVINYPLAVNIFAYDTPKLGISHVAEYYNGIQALSRRSDSLAAVESAIDQLSTLTEEEQGIRLAFAESLYAYLQESHDSDNAAQPERFTTHSDYTPNGSKIYMYYNLTWADHGTTITLAQQADLDMRLAYPNATHLRNKNPKYNCHSYAWYSTSSSNPYWMDGSYAAIYMSDGSYYQVTSPASGDRIWYGSGDHSGIMYSSTKVTSKWGMLGLYRHTKADCPYSGAKTYWRR